MTIQRQIGLSVVGVSGLLTSSVVVSFIVVGVVNVVDLSDVLTYEVVVWSTVVGIESVVGLFEVLSN